MLVRARLTSGGACGLVAVLGLAAVGALLVGFMVGAAPLPMLLLAFVLPLLFLREARAKGLFVLVALLITVSHTVSVISVAGVPVCSLSLIMLGFAFRKELLQALSENGALRLILVIWLVWFAWTLVRLKLDFPTYGILAIRDAAPLIDFGAVLVGAACVNAYPSADRAKALSRLTLILALYGLLFPLSTGGVLSSLTFLNFANAGPAGLAVFGAGLWASTNRQRALYLLVGLAAIAVSQVRMMYIGTLVLLVVFLVTRTDRHPLDDRQPVNERPPVNGRPPVNQLSPVNERHPMDDAAPAGAAPVTPPRPSRSRAGAIGFLAFVVFFLGVGLPALPFLTGRVGAVTVQTMTAQLSQVADPGGDDSGSVGDRARWWNTVMTELTGTPSNMVYGMGLGKDLLNGYRSRDGALVRKPHNDVLEWFARDGVIGLLGVGTFVLMALVYSWRCLRIDSANGPLFAWALAAVLTALSQPYFAYSHGVIPLALLLGYALVQSKQPKSAPAAAEPLKPPSNRPAARLAQPARL